MYKKIVLMILCFLVAISCSNPNSPNTTNTNQTGDTNKVETVTPPCELEKYGVDISQDDDVIASQLESNLKLYFDEKGSYKVILKGIPKDYGFNSTTKSLAYLIFNAANKVGANSVDVDISNIDFRLQTVENDLQNKINQNINAVEARLRTTENELQELREQITRQNHHITCLEYGAGLLLGGAALFGAVCYLKSSSRK